MFKRAHNINVVFGGAIGAAALVSLMTASCSMQVDPPRERTVAEGAELGFQPRPPGPPPPPHVSGCNANAGIEVTAQYNDTVVFGGHDFDFLNGNQVEVMMLDAAKPWIVYASTYVRPNSNGNISGVLYSCGAGRQVFLWAPQTACGYHPVSGGFTMSCFG
jgi:hypothetical protein